MKGGGVHGGGIYIYIYTHMHMRPHVPAVPMSGHTANNRLDVIALNLGRTRVLTSILLSAGKGTQDPGPASIQSLSPTKTESSNCKSPMFR